jgi:CO/xanthine dehydrogenase FAD-binding subunit
VWQNIGHANLRRLSRDFSPALFPKKILTHNGRLFHTRAAASGTLYYSAMKPAPFRYVAARTIEQALELKAAHGDEARFLAGGQSLVPTLNFRLTQPEMLIDINPLAQFAGLTESGPGHVRIGALTRYRSLERDPVVAEKLPIIHEAVPLIAHPQIRNRGTIGGNLAHADPASEMPAIVLALGGRMRAQALNSERWIAAADFFAGALSTTLGPDEMLTEIELPVARPRSGACFMEISRRRGDFALIGVACIVQLDDGGRCVKASIALCNAGDGPVFAAHASASLAGEKIGASEIDVAADLVQRNIEPGGNVHASKEFQRHLAGVLTTRALTEANKRAQRDH